MNINYIRFNNGEEIVASVISEDGHHIILDNPLLIEQCPTEEGNQMIFLSRYNAYAESTSVEIPLTNVILNQAASETMIEYYTRSVDFCKTYIDKKFIHGIKSATAYVDHILKQLAINGEILEDEVESPTEEDDFIDQNQIPVLKPTVH